MKAPEIGNDREITEDQLFSGRLSCRQYRDGYRFSVDSVVLAHFPALKKGETILDLGAGAGVIGLILLYRNPELLLSLTGYENQPELAELARHNFDRNGFEARSQVVIGDVREHKQLLMPESFSLVISNPPYYRAGSGRLSKGSQNREARHQLEAELNDFVQAAAHAVRNKGRVVMIYPASGLAELVVRLSAAQLFLKRLQLVYSYPRDTNEARLALVEAVKNGGIGTRVLEPLYIYAEKGGSYSSRLQAMYRP